MTWLRNKRAWRAATIGLVVMAATLTIPAQSATAVGSEWIDPTYGADGITTFPGESAFLAHFAMDAADRMYTASSDGVTARLRRLTADGDVDPTFAGGSRVLALMPETVHADAGGTVTVAAIDPGDGAVVSRYTGAGDPDPGFGTGGSASILDGVPVGTVTSIAERPGGGLVVGLVDFSAFPSTSYVVALTAAGGLDPTWVPGGPQPGVLALSSTNVVGVAADGGAVVLAADASGFGNWVAQRLTSAGAIDAGFAPGGQVALTGLAPRSVLVGGGAYYFAGIRQQVDGGVAVMKVLATGSVDAGFGTSGIAHGPGNQCLPVGIQVMLTASHLYVAGQWINCGPGRPVVIDRFSFAGVLDSSYGTAGEVTIDAIGSHFIGDGAYEVGMQASGRIVVGTSTVDDNNIFLDAVVFRVLNDQAPPAAGSYVSLSPARILDTRFGNGAPTGAIPGGGSIDLQVTGRGGVPPSGVGAVVMNVTVTQPSFNGNVVAYPTGSAFPLASNLNFDTGQTIPNLVTVKVGVDGKVTLKNNSTGTVHLVADVAGYYLSGTATLPGTFTPLAPARILDTRFGNGAPTGPVAGGGSIDLQVTGRGGVPASGVGAVVMNVTVTQPSWNGNVVAYPAGAAFPLASNLNFQPGQTIPNLVTVKVGAGGQVTLKNNSTGTVQLVADVAGYYLDGTATAPGTFVPLTPARVLDTRIGNNAPVGPIAGGGSLDIVVAGLGGVSFQAVAVVLNLTVTQPSWNGNVVAYPTGSPFPLASNLNFVPGQTIPNLAIVKLGDSGQVTLKNNSTGTVHLVADVAGYFLT